MAQKKDDIRLDEGSLKKGGVNDEFQIKVRPPPPPPLKVSTGNSGKDKK